MKDQDNDMRLDRLLGELDAEDVPAGFRDRTMIRISTQSTVGKITRITTTGGTTMRKRTMWGLATAAAILLAYFAVRGFPTVDQGSEATIGAAKRYQAGQIQSKDVVLGDQSLQQFMQSDVFDRLVKDPAAVKALSDAGIREQIANAEILKSLSDPRLLGLLSRYAGTQNLSALSCGGCQAALESAEVQAALLDRNFTNALQDAEFIAMLQDTRIAAALARHDLEAGLSRLKLEAALNTPNIGAALQNTQFLAAIKSPQFVSAIRDQQFCQAIQSPAFLLAISNAKLASAIQSQSFQMALRMAGFNAALRAESFANAMQVSAAQLAR